MDLFRQRTGRVLAFLLVAAIAFGGFAWQLGWVRLPDRYNPWAPLDPMATPNMLTSFKLQRAQGNAPQCFAALAASGAHYQAAADRVTGEGCGLKDAVLLRKGHRFALKAPTLLSCRAALSLAMWERHALQPAAQAHLGQPVAVVEHLGSYACRSVRTGDDRIGVSGRRSMHATADAIDISGFVAQDGRRVSIRRDWGTAIRPEPADNGAGAFLHRARAGACDFFDAVLSPDYNALHADHLHFEVGGWRNCR